MSTVICVDYCIDDTFVIKSQNFGDRFHLIHLLLPNRRWIRGKRYVRTMYMPNLRLHISLLCITDVRNYLISSVCYELQTDLLMSFVNGSQCLSNFRFYLLFRKANSSAQMIYNCNVRGCPWTCVVIRAGCRMNWQFSNTSLICCQF